MTSAAAEQAEHKTGLPDGLKAGIEALSARSLDEVAAASVAPAQLEAESPPSPNRTGLPDGLKAGIESLSGMAMDHVKVHYNSAQPAQLNALAYAQGSDIHVAQGQEKHLPHEAWHFVQQAQGRVKPTMQMKDGVPVNDDAGFEREADVMGAKAAIAVNMSDPSGIFQRRAESAEAHPQLEPASGQGEKGPLNFLSSLHTAAHEAAHVVQQRAGVQLKGGVGEEGDAYERHADAVADRVVAGESAEALLDTAAGDGASRAVQRKPVEREGNVWGDDEYPDLELKFVEDEEGLIKFTVMGGTQDGRTLLWDSSDRVYVWGDNNETANNELHAYKGEVELNNDGGKTYNFKEARGVKVISLSDLDKVKMRDKPKDPSGLIKAMKSNVPLDPIKVEETEDGIEIVDGFTRLLASRAIGWVTVPVVFV